MPAFQTRKRKHRVVNQPESGRYPLLSLNSLQNFLLEGRRKGDLWSSGTKKLEPEGLAQLVQTARRTKA
eukprot:6196667-Pleurochrysis_carterae.AAC.1